MQDKDSFDQELDNELGLDNSYGGMDDFGGFGDVSNINKYNDLLKELTNFDPTIQRRVRNWLGLEWDEDAKGYRQKDEAIINAKGAKWAIGFLQTYQSKTNIITNINQHEFKNLQLDLITMCWLVFPTIEDFDVKSTADWYRLCTELEHSAFLVLAGAGDGKYTKFLGESVHRTESVQLNNQPRLQGYAGQQQPETKKGMINKFKNMLLGR